jgi:hypothetical protein
MEESTTLVYFVLATAMLVVILWRLRFSHPISLVASYYYFFAFGPVLNLLLGQAIFRGIVLSHLNNAILMQLLVMFVFCFASLFLRKKTVPPREIEAGSFYAMNFPLALAALAGCVLIVLAFPFRDLDKTVQIAAMGSFHYSYLLIQFYLASLYFLCVARRTRQLWYLNFAIYVLYGLVTSERDFLYCFGTIVFYHLYLKPTGLSRRDIIIGTTAVLICVVGATMLFVIRGSNLQLANGLNLQSILNQGSLLFVNSQVSYVVASGSELWNGASYLHALSSLIPFYESPPAMTPSDWLVSYYSPGSSSGYGFSLEAEAYLNFGYLGIFLVFGIIILIQHFAFKRVGKPFFLYFSVFFTTFFLNGVRNDSYGFIKATIYALIFYALIRLYSLRPSGILGLRRSMTSTNWHQKRPPSNQTLQTKQRSLR